MYASSRYVSGALILPRVFRLTRISSTRISSYAYFVLRVFRLTFYFGSILSMCWFQHNGQQRLIFMIADRPEWRGDLGFMHSAARGRGCATAPLSAVFSRHHLLHHHQQRPCAAQERRRCEYLRA